jgi:hypothetical protein
MRSQSHFVLWKILSDFGLLAAVATAFLSHIDRIDRMYMVPARNNVPRTARPAANPPSFDWYKVISDWFPSSGPPPRRRIVSSYFSRTHPWYPTPNNIKQSVTVIRSTGLSKSNGDRNDSAWMSPVSRWMCLGKARNESPMPNL